MDIVMSSYFPSMPGANKFLHSLRSIITPVYCEFKENYTMWNTLNSAIFIGCSVENSGWFLWYQQHYYITILYIPFALVLLLYQIWFSYTLNLSIVYSNSNR